MNMLWWKKFFAAATAAFVILVAILLARSALVSQPQAPVSPSPVAFHVDAMQAAERLAGAIRIPTVSEQEAGKTNHQTFIELHAYFERAFPKVHATLKHEVVGEYTGSMNASL